MSVCDECGQEVGPLLCGHCREKVQDEVKAATDYGPDNLLPLVFWDKEKECYRWGCTCLECPWNVGGVCGQEAPSVLDANLHEFDGDNIVRQWCG